MNLVEILVSLNRLDLDLSRDLIFYAEIKVLTVELVQISIFVHEEKNDIKIGGF